MREGLLHEDLSVEMWVIQLSMHPCHCWHPTKAPAVGRSLTWTHTLKGEVPPYHSHAVGQWLGASCSCVPWEVLRLAQAGLGMSQGDAQQCPTRVTVPYLAPKTLPPPFTNFFVSFILVFRLNPLYLFVMPFLFNSISSLKLPL